MVIRFDSVKYWNVRCEMNLTDIIEKLQYITNSLRSYNIIIKLPSCNDCNKIKKCEYRPGWGEHVRINCPLWQAENKEEKE